MTRYWQNLFVCQRSIWIEVSITYQRKRKVGIEKLKYPKAFTGYSQIVDNFYETLEDYNPTKNKKVLIVFNEMVADMEA